MCIARISCLHTISIAERVREKALISGGNADILAATKEIILLLLCICRHMYRHIGSWLSIPGCLGNCYDLCGEREIDYWRSAMNNNISTLKHCTLLWPGAFKWTSTINSDSHGYVDLSIQQPTISNWYSVKNQPGLVTILCTCETTEYAIIDIDHNSSGVALSTTSM